jgi:N-acetylneuraminic acid mutarotase
MIRVDVPRFGAIRTLVSAGLFAIGLVASTAVPAFAGGWTNTGRMITARSGHTATLLPNGQVLVAGGNAGASGNRLTSTELYDPATGQWAITGSMAAGRQNHSAMLLPNGEVLVAGGIHSVSIGGNVTWTATAEIYSPFNGQWTTTGSMTTARSSQGSTLLPNGEVLVAGGINGDSGTLASAELYDPSTGTWTATGKMNFVRSAQATLLEDGRVLMAGGNGNTAELYSNGHWTLTSNMKYSHPGCRAALLTTGNVLAVGGNLASWSCEFYDPGTDTWMRTHNFGTSVPGGPLTLLFSGEVLLVGGEDTYGTTGFSALYDPSTNSWGGAGNLHQARTAHTATLLPNGEVLAAGGQVKNSNGTFSFLASAELYTP